MYRGPDAPQRRLELFVLQGFNLLVVVAAIVGVFLEDWVMVAICMVAVAVNGTIDGTLPKNVHYAGFSERARERLAPPRGAMPTEASLRGKELQFACLAGVTVLAIAADLGQSWWSALVLGVAAWLLAFAAAHGAMHWAAPRPRRQRPRH